MILKQGIAEVERLSPQLGILYRHTLSRALETHSPSAVLAAAKEYDKLLRR